MWETAEQKATELSPSSKFAVYRTVEGSGEVTFAKAPELAHIRERPEFPTWGF